MTGRSRPHTKERAREPRVDRFDIAILVVFSCVSLWVLGLDIWQVIAHGRSWTGTDGILPQDQMQYLAWVQSASQHLLASNLFALRATPADYFQPVITISGGITALGVAPWFALLIWKPVGVAAAFFAIRAYVRRSIAGRWPRRAALVLALFFGFFGVTADLWQRFWTWGYPFELIALAAMLGALLVYDRALAANRGSWAAPLLGALASSVHPWQGEALIVIVIIAAVLTRTDRTCGRGIGLLVATVTATAAPLVYYAILDRTDTSWRLAQIASRGTWSLSRIALDLAPLALPATLATGGDREPSSPPPLVPGHWRHWPSSCSQRHL